MTTDGEMTAKQRAGCIDLPDAPLEEQFTRAKKQIVEQIRAAEQTAVARERADWQRWLAETRIAAAEQDFDIETAIVCGNKQPTLHDAGQCGYAAAIFVWEAACKKWLASLSQRGGEAG